MLQQGDPGVVARVALRRALEAVVALHLDGMPFDVTDGLFEIGAGAFMGHGAAVPIQLIGGHAVHPARRGQSVGGQLKVVGSDRGADVGIVRRLVWAETDISVRAKHLALPEIGGQFDEEGSHRRQYVDVVTALIEELRACRILVDYDELQRRLFQLLHSREEHKGSCRRCATRLRRGKSLPTPLPQLPPGADPNDPETWRIEDLVFDRVCRQLRAVGDGLAWRVSGYDRRYIIALSSNESPGPIVGKAGLPAELGAAVEMRNRGSLGLLHDITNCLRIGDVTEFTPGEPKLLYEIKSSPNANTRVPS